MDDLQQIFNFIAVIGFISIVIMTLCSINGFFIYPKGYDKSKDDLPFKLVAAGFIIFLGIAVIVIPGFTYAWLSIINGGFLSEDKFELTALQQSWGSIISIIVTFFILMVYLSRCSRKWINIIFGFNFFNSKRWLQDAFLGIGTWFICIPLVATVDGTMQILISYIFDKSPVDQSAVRQLKLSSADPILHVLTIGTVVMIVPIMEEILFRGLLQSWFRKFMGRSWGLLCSAFVFAAFHFSVIQGVTNIQILSDLFVLSCFLGFIFERQQSLLSSIFLHMTFNAVSVLRLLY